MVNGYLNSSPFEAFILAITMKTTLIIKSIPIKGIPTTINTRGLMSIIYRRIDRLKFSAAFPFSLTHNDSSLLDIQQINGPMIPPKGKTNPAKADRWQSIDQFLSVSVSTRISFMI